MGKENNVVINLLRLGAFLQRTGNRLLNDFDLNQQQFVVLRHISIHGPVSQKDICSELLFEKSNISKIIKKLIQNDLIENIYSTADNRFHQLVITKKGKQIIDECMKRFDSWNNGWLKSLPIKEVNQISQMLEKLCRL